MAIKNNINFKDIHTPQQKEALINEIKGNLFEYLVAHELAKTFDIESKFISRFSGAIKDMFRHYESWLRENDRDLIYKLPVLAKDVSKRVATIIDFSPEEILVIGKITGGFHNDVFKEADILIYSQENELPISLKLCKSNAYVNTKSAGAKSFVSKYFSNFDQASLMQETLNKIIDSGFLEMGQALYELEGLKFHDRFDQQWTGPELPGELSPKQKDILSDFYQKLNSQFYSIANQLYKEDKNKFNKCLLPLMGQGSEKIVNVTCFHKEKTIDGNKSKYELSDIHISQYKDLYDKVKILPLKKEISSFDISLGKDILQLRIKPMNKFTTPSYKVNCSIRYGKNV
jgi:hypothetical protein